MNKAKRITSIIAAIAVVSYLVILGVGKAHAAAPQTNIAIIDTGFDSSVFQFSGKVVDEVCFTLLTCPNNKSFQEGPGAAELTKAQLSVSGATHGTQMLSASIMTNPNANYVYIRAYDVYNGVLLSPSDASFATILTWIDQNHTRLNIGAVAFSAARNITTACPDNASVDAIVNDLINNGIPVIAAAGNNYDYVHVSYPACLSPIISVGALDAYNGHALYSNAGVNLKFDALGVMTVSNGGTSTIQSTGTSLATQVFAADWISIKQAKPTLTYAQEYALIQKTQTLTSGYYVKNVPTINVIAALK